MDNQKHGRPGFVDTEAFVSDTVSSDESSEIFDKGRIEGRAIVSDIGLFNDAVISGAAVVSRTIVREAGNISGNANVDLARVEGNAKIYEKAYIRNVDFRGNSHVFGAAKLVIALQIGLTVTLDGDCKFGGDATFDGLITSEDFVKKYGADKVTVDERGNIVLTDVWDMGDK